MTIADEINRLDQLHESGALTDEEFAEAKRQVLADGGTAVWVEGSGQIFGINETTWCTLMHLSQLINWSIVGLILPVAMWVLSKDQSEIARRHGARIINWLASSLIYYAVGGILFWLLIGVPIVIATFVLSLVFPIMAAVKCNRGEIWSYPLAIRFLPED